MQGQRSFEQANGDGSSRPSWLDRCLLIYGPRKSGTTLVQCCLDGCPELFVLPGEVGVSQENIAPEPLWKLASVSTGTMSEIKDCLSTSMGPTDALEQVRRFVAELAERSIADTGNLARWAIKDVGGNPTNGVERLTRIISDIRILMILRDPKMVSRAVYTNRRRRGIKLTWRQVLIEAADPLVVLARQAQFLGDPRVTWIEYEELVAEPRATMEGVTRSLGTSVWDGMTEPTELGCPVIVATASESRNGVFLARRRWWDGLVIREVLAVVLTSICLPLPYRVRTRRPLMTYRRMRDAVQTSNSQARREEIRSSRDQD